MHAGMFHLARRSLEAIPLAITASDDANPPEGQMPQFKVSVAGSILMALTLMAFLVIIVSVS